MIEAKDTDTLDTRVLRLSNYLNRAYKHNKASILFALYLSEFLRSDMERSLSALLKEQGLQVAGVDAGAHKDLPAFFSSTNSEDTVFFVHNIEKGFSEALQFLNFKRENLIEDRVKVIFWVTEEELSRISREAPDFFAFRNRVVEFMEVPHAGELRPALVEFALETEYRSLDEIKRSIELKEKLLSELSAETEISEYLLGSLGDLYFQIGLYEKSIDCSEKALKIAKDIGDRCNEGVWLGNLGNAYRALRQVDKAIEYYKDALVISRALGDRSGEGADLGNLGNAYIDLEQVDKAIEYYEDALAISREVVDRRTEGAALGNLGMAYYAPGQVDKAIKYYEDALVITREIGDRIGEGFWLGNIGIAYSELGQVEKAIKYYEGALTIGKEIKDPNIIDFCKQKLKSLKNSGD